MNREEYLLKVKAVIDEFYDARTNENVIVETIIENTGLDRSVVEKVYKAYIYSKGDLLPNDDEMITKAAKESGVANDKVFDTWLALYDANQQRREKYLKKLKIGVNRPADLSPSDLLQIEDVVEETRRGAQLWGEMEKRVANLAEEKVETVEKILSAEFDYMSKIIEQENKKMRQIPLPDE
jgi:hypothetical protein